MILTTGFLDNQANSRGIYATDSAQRRVLYENETILKKSNKYDIFLSHRYMDGKRVITLVNMFNDAGYSVYVDWLEDPELDRNNVTVYTAALLKLRLLSSKGLTFLATDNSSYSKWCPWELGYMDGKNGRCCILPVLDYNATAFKGVEYLGLYPYIEYDTQRGTGKFDFWVYDQNDNTKYVRLDFWLNGVNPTKH